MEPITLWMHNFGTRLVPNPTLENNFSLWKLAQALTKWARSNQLPPPVHHPSEAPYNSIVGEP